jgi:superfamily II DNA or RNA helicase
MEYFKPAVQLGLTATPKRTINADTYDYFGEPVYVYSLKEGINDGFLTPFKVKQIDTTIDEYVFQPLKSSNNTNFTFCSKAASLSKLFSSKNLLFCEGYKTTISSNNSITDETDST